MAISPKNPRKRAAKKTPKVKAEVSPETTPVVAVLPKICLKVFYDYATAY